MGSRSPGQQDRHRYRPGAALFFWLLQVALSSATAPEAATAAEAEAAASAPAIAAHPLQPLDPTALVIDESLGQVMRRYPASSSITTAHTPARTLILIQDAHVNYEAQRHMAQIIDQLARTYGLSLVMVEGGSGDVSLTEFRQSASLEKRREVAERFLTEGKLSGEEFLDLTVDYPLTLWGIEDSALYDEHLRLSLATEPIRDGLSPLLGQLRQALDDVKSRRYAQPLGSLEWASADYQAHRLSLDDYLTRLLQAAAAHQVSLEDLLALTRYRDAKDREAAVDLRQVEAEQQQALRLMKGRLSAKTWNELTEAAKAVDANQRSLLSYYQLLERGLWGARSELSSYPHLAAYVAYLMASEQLDPAELSRDLAALAWRLKARLAGSPDERALVALDQRVYLLQRLFTMDLTPAEHLILQRDLAEHLSWADEASAVLGREGVDRALIDALARIAAAVPQLEQFYGAARRREDAFIHRITEKLTETGTPTAIARLGGFHALHVAQRLSEQGISVVVVSPKTSQPTDEALYRRMLRYKADLPITDSR